MPRWIACGLLLLHGGLAVALAMDAFFHLTLLAVGAVPLLVTLLASRKALLVVVPAVPLSFHTSSLDSRESSPSAALPCYVIPAAAIDLASRRFAV